MATDRELAYLKTGTNKKKASLVLSIGKRSVYLKHIALNVLFVRVRLRNRQFVA